MKNSKGRFVKGNLPWNTGLKGKYKLGPNKTVVLEETKEKIRVARIGVKLTDTNPNYKYKVIEYKCIVCDKISVRVQSSKQKLCSIKCASKHCKKLFSGENNSRWKGGYQNSLHLNRNRRAQKKLCKGNHSLRDWELLKKQYNYTCPCCKKAEPDIVLTEDHIIPISKNGSNNIENIQPLCRSCNSKKSTKAVKF